MEVVHGLLALVSHLPTTASGFWGWAIGMGAAHLVLGYIVKWMMGQSPFSDAAVANLWPRVGTGMTFGTSIMLLLGLAYPRLLALVGDTKPFLAIAGLVGAAYGVISLGRKD